MAQLKIQLGVDDLDKILSGQTEAGVEIKSWVVQEFTRRYLKGVLEADAYKEIEMVLSKALETYVREHVGQWSWNGVTKLNDNVRAEIARTVSAEVQQLVSRAVQDAMKLQWDNYLSKLEQIVEARMEKMTIDYVDREVKRRMEEALTVLALPKV